MSRWQNDLDTPPPERHADRVIGEMMRDLARKRATVVSAIGAAVRASKDGGPRAQRRMAERIAAAGAVRVDIETGTRGRYRMSVFDLLGWDRDADEPIINFHPIPDRPWLACMVTYIDNRGRDRKSAAALFVSHHALSRAAQRFQLRTADHIIDLSEATLLEAMTQIPAEQWLNSPSEGHHVKIGDGMTAVLRPHEHGSALVVMTFLFEPT